ncbi:putative G2-specific protein kinase nimA [Blattamonas nauphoetae]|uniref:non-specific serine/threonine protein kinase n=1 Tax=Blattamonas nauphoetae TaxID=2049346 RepID=A0ABQ9Y6S4_9EUKA|nr:putative G2-specific protein kinase nimA [Blattamonas nauphoetae]
MTSLTAKEKEDNLKEVFLLAQLNSPYVIRYYDSFFHENTLNMIMELAEQGTLNDFILSSKENGESLPEEVVWRFIIEIALGLDHIHSHKIIHRDIKSLNIFLATGNTVKIGDLGVARTLGTASFAQTTVGTPYYLSPELVQGEPYNEKSDLWAFGCVIYELCTFRKPFEAPNQAALLMKIMQASPPPLPSDTYSATLIEIVMSFLNPEPKKRMSLRTLLEKPETQKYAAKFQIPLPYIPVASISQPSIANIPTMSPPKPRPNSPRTGQKYNHYSSTPTSQHAPLATRKKTLRPPQTAPSPKPQLVPSKIVPPPAVGPQQDELFPAVGGTTSSFKPLPRPGPVKARTGRSMDDIESLLGPAGSSTQSELKVHRRAGSSITGGRIQRQADSPTITSTGYSSLRSPNTRIPHSTSPLQVNHQADEKSPDDSQGAVGEDEADDCEEENVGEKESAEETPKKEMSEEEKRGRELILFTFDEEALEFMDEVEPDDEQLTEDDRVKLKVEFAMRMGNALQSFTDRPKKKKKKRGTSEWVFFFEDERDLLKQTDTPFSLDEGLEHRASLGRGGDMRIDGRGVGSKDYLRERRLENEQKNNMWEEADLNEEDEAEMRNQAKIEARDNVNLQYAWDTNGKFVIIQKDSTLLHDMHELMNFRTAKTKKASYVQQNIKEAGKPKRRANERSKSTEGKDAEKDGAGKKVVKTVSRRSLSRERTRMKTDELACGVRVPIPDPASPYFGSQVVVKKPKSKTDTTSGAAGSNDKRGGKNATRPVLAKKRVNTGMIVVGDGTEKRRLTPMRAGGKDKRKEEDVQVGRHDGEKEERVVMGKAELLFEKDTRNNVTEFLKQKEEEERKLEEEAERKRQELEARRQEKRRAEEERMRAEEEERQRKAEERMRDEAEREDEVGTDEEEEQVESNEPNDHDDGEDEQDEWEGDSHHEGATDEDGQEEWDDGQRESDEKDTGEDGEEQDVDHHYSDEFDYDD